MNNTDYNLDVKFGELEIGDLFYFNSEIYAKISEAKGSSRFSNLITLQYKDIVKVNQINIDYKRICKYDNKIDMLARTTISKIYSCRLEKLNSLKLEDKEFIFDINEKRVDTWDRKLLKLYKEEQNQLSSILKNIVNKNFNKNLDCIVNEKTENLEKEISECVDSFVQEKIKYFPQNNNQNKNTEAFQFTIFLLILISISAISLFCILILLISHYSSIVN